MIEKNEFLKIINATPLVSIDLIIQDPLKRILLGKRTNRPAQNYWFVPGGRINKNETIADAFKRISLAEIGHSIPFYDAQLLGAYDHIYDDNAFSKKGINTHYVVLAYLISLKDKLDVTPDNQHSEIKWWSKNNLIDAADVHQNTKAYFTRT